MALRAAGERRPGERPAPRDGDRPDVAEGGWEIARSGGPGDGVRAGEPAAAWDPERARPDARPGAERRGAPEAPGGSGAAARGAGKAVDPRLLGAPTDPGGGRETFDVPIVARVRALPGGPGLPAGEPPPATPDARPALAPGQRRDAPVAKADVPPAYEDLVRQLFAHRGAGPEP
jgi:hypothetical protein